MSLLRGVKPAFAGIIGIVIVVLVAVVLVNILSSEPPVQNLIYKSLELRDAKDSVDRANLITDLDDLVVDVKNPRVREQWDRMLECLSASCPNEAFLDMVLVVVAEFESDIPNDDLLINVIATAKYWGNPDHMLDFSKALSSADDGIKKLEVRGAEKKWDQIVECNGVCPEMYDLYFDLIKTIVK